MDFFTVAPPLEGLALKACKGASCQLDVAALEGARALRCCLKRTSALSTCLIRSCTCFQ